MNFGRNLGYEKILMNNVFSYACVEQTNYTDDISLLKCAPIAEKLHYDAGQYVEIQLLNGALLPLSIANAPKKNGYLEFHLRHNRTQPMAQQLLSEISQTNTLTLRGPFGRSTLQRVLKSQRLVFLAGGTGFAPIKALLEKAFQENRNTVMDLYWGISRPIDAYEVDWIKTWQARIPHFRHQLVLSNAEKYPSWSGDTGLIADFCASRHPHFEKTCVFASGPFEMIKAAYPLLISKGLPSTSFISDMLVSAIELKSDDEPIQGRIPEVAQ